VPTARVQGYEVGADGAGVHERAKHDYAGKQVRRRYGNGGGAVPREPVGVIEGRRCRPVPANAGSEHPDVIPPEREPREHPENRDEPDRAAQECR